MGGWCYQTVTSGPVTPSYQAFLAISQHMYFVFVLLLYLIDICMSIVQGMWVHMCCCICIRNIIIIIIITACVRDGELCNDLQTLMIQRCTATHPLGHRCQHHFHHHHILTSSSHHPHHHHIIITIMASLQATDSRLIDNCWINLGFLSWRLASLLRSSAWT